ncbi:MAG: flagellar basal body-associated protein FliL [Methylophilaceae bacterium]
MAQEPEVAEEVAEEAPKKSKKKLIIIIVAALVLIGGGLAAWLLMGGESDDHGEDGEAEQHEEVVVKEPIFIKLDTFTVNLNPDEGEKFLQVDITLNTTESHDADHIEKYMPQVRNRVLMILTSKLASEISSMEGKEALSEELTEQVNEPYGEGSEPLSIAEVFFTSFVIQ